MMLSGPDKADGIERKILQTGGVLVFRLQMELEKIMKVISEDQKISKLSINQFNQNIFSPEEKKYWEEKRIIDILREAKENLGLLIEDFRLKDLVEHAYLNDQRNL